MRKVNLGDAVNNKQLYVFFSFAVMKTYEITANDMCEASRAEFAEYFECMVEIPPF